MQAQRPSPSLGSTLVSGIATEPSSILAAQRLRFDVFTKEYGADLGASNGVDTDRFDPHCEHIVVVNQDNEQVVATTRVLHGNVAAQLGGFYSENEFELDKIKRNPGVFAELGRTCVHVDYRHGTALNLLWAAVCQYLIERKVDYLIGCASISMVDGGRRAWLVAQKLQAEHLTPEQFRALPKRELPHIANSSSTGATAEIPPLIKAYMRLGAQVCGAPCWDPSFRCADLLVLLEVDRMATRYARKFMRY